MCQPDDYGNPQKDIQSPTNIARNKRKAKAESALAAGQTIAQPVDSLASPTNGTHAANVDTRLHRPPVLHPISAKAKAATANNQAGKMPGSAGQGGFPDLPSPGLRGPMPGHNGDKADGKQEAKIIGYAVAIYPYTAEREDEYDVLM